MSLTLGVGMTWQEMPCSAPLTYQAMPHAYLTLPLGPASPRSALLSAPPRASPIHPGPTLTASSLVPERHWVWGQQHLLRGTSGVCT